MHHRGELGVWVREGFHGATLLAAEGGRLLSLPKLALVLRLRSGPQILPLSPILTQIPISSLGTGSLHSAPKAYNSGPILSCLKTFDGKRGSKRYWWEEGTGPEIKVRLW